MVPPELEKPRVTEIQVRIDCNGCVQKIKKALHGINGIYDVYIDFPQQKLTVIGWADPERIVKAIRKTKKIATICSHTELPEQPPPQPPEQPPEGGAPPDPPPETSNPPPQEAPPTAEGGPPAEPPSDQPPPENPQPTADLSPPPAPPPQSENPPPEATPTPDAAETNADQTAQYSRPKDVGEVHVVCHHPPDHSYRYGYGYGYRGYWDRYPQERFQPPQPIYMPHGYNTSKPPPPYAGDYNHISTSPQEIQQPPQPIHVSHSYNTYKPSPYITEYRHVNPSPEEVPQPQQPASVAHGYNTCRPSPYITEYEYVSPPPQHINYSRADYHNEYHNRNGNITTIFSDENPNACRVM